MFNLVVAAVILIFQLAISTNSSATNCWKVVQYLCLSCFLHSYASYNDNCTIGNEACNKNSFKGINNLQLENCMFAESINIANCTNITISNITIENSRETGLVLINNTGNIIIENSTFRNNGQSYTESSTIDSMSELEEIGGGGGLQILIGGDVRNSSVTIKDCVFANNTANASGGGLLVIIRPNAQENNVHIINSNFTDNKCEQCAGGGLQIGYVTRHSEEVMENSIYVQDCIFSDNSALYGGGTAVFANKGSLNFSESNKLEFINCLWTENTAKLGLSVDIAIAPWETFTRAGLFPSPVFTSCTFSMHKDTTDARSPKSVLSVTGFRVDFRGTTSFRENEATALEATSAELNFAANSNFEFIKNQGVNGGAIKLNGLTVMFIQDNSTFKFEKNTANRGGAIYVESYKHSLIPSQSCFIQYKPPDDKQRLPSNVSFIFINNTANYTDTNNCDPNYCKYSGDSVFATSITSCLRNCLKLLNNAHSNTATDALKCLGTFSFDKPSQETFFHCSKSFQVLRDTTSK